MLVWWESRRTPLVGGRKVLGAAALSGGIVAVVERVLKVRLRLAGREAVGELGLLVMRCRRGRHIVGVVPVLMRTILL